MNYNQLSIDQAPSISTPFLFFITAPLFAIAAALMLLITGPEILHDRWLPPTLAITHLITLGFITMIMMGAMFQLLPVMAGAPIARPQIMSRLIYGLYTPGIICLTSGLAVSQPWLIKIAVVLIALAFLCFLIPVSSALFKSDNRGASVKGMTYSITALWIAVCFGLLLATGHGWDTIPLIRKLTALHIAWAAVGWITILIISIAYQVIPMFQITIDYPPILNRYLTTIIFVILIAWSLAYYYGLSSSTSFNWLITIIAFSISLLLIIFIVITLKMQIQRKKRMADATLYFWVTGLISLFLALALYCYGSLMSIKLDLLIGIVFFTGFVTSVMNGMLYKIVPFLVWLHLHRKLAFKTEMRSRIPTMNDVISSKKSFLQLYLHHLALLLSIGASFAPGLLLYPAALCWLINWSLLLLHISQALWLYRSCLTSK